MWQQQFLMGIIEPDAMHKVFGGRNVYPFLKKPGEKYPLFNCLFMKNSLSGGNIVLLTFSQGMFNQCYLQISILKDPCTNTGQLCTFLFPKICC